MNVLTPVSSRCLPVPKHSSLKKKRKKKKKLFGIVVCHGIFPLSHFLEKHKRQSFRGTLQRGDQEAGFGACWRSYPASQAYTALQRLPQQCGLSSYGPGWVCGDWPCSEWTPMVPCSNNDLKKKKRGIFRVSVGFIELIDIVPRLVIYFLGVEKLENISWK